MNSLHVEKIVCGLYETNAYLIYRDDMNEALLIDPGDDPLKCLKALADSGKTLTDIALTHGHFDHIMGVPYLKKLTGAKVTVSQEDAYMLMDGEKALCGEKTGLDHFVPFEADAYFDHNGLYIACGLPFRVIHTPGHSKGSTCLYLPEQYLLISGDTIFAYGFGRTDFEGGSLPEQKTSLQTLFALPKETVIMPGHGESGVMSTYHKMLKRI